jgi:glycosyltransferase involved in cell wall biosynthesis
MSKYNILYLHNKSEISGGERSLLSLWENLDRTFFTPLLAAPYEGELTRQARLLDVEVIIFSCPKLLPWNIFAIGRAIGLLKGIVERHHIRLVHSHTPRNNIIASIVGKIMRVPVIWHERNIPMGNEFDVTKMLLLLPDAIICNSGAVAKRLGKAARKAKVILNGVDVRKFSSDSLNIDLKKQYRLEDKMVVGIVTNLSIRRKIDHFIEAARLIHTERPQTVFFIVGGEFEEESRGRQKALETYSQSLGLKEYLFFLGFQEDVRPWIAMFDVCCHVTSQDACSRSVLEAMAMAKAIVAMNDGGNPELIENGKSGLLVAPDSPNDFAKNVICLLDNPSQRKQLGEAARQRAQDLFSITRNTQTTKNLYLDLIKGQPSE